MQLHQRIGVQFPHRLYLPEVGMIELAYPAASGKGIGVLRQRIGPAYPRLSVLPVDGQGIIAEPFEERGIKLYLAGVGAETGLLVFAERIGLFLAAYLVYKFIMGHAHRLHPGVVVFLQSGSIPGQLAVGGYRVAVKPA